MTREEEVKALARECGFSLVGIAGVDPDPEHDAIYQKWLDADKHGDMSYLHRHREVRSDPRKLLPSARSAVCVAVNYYQNLEVRQRTMDGSDGRGRFSVYVHGRDYHKVLGRMLKDLGESLSQRFPGVELLPCVDTKPISDRSMAIRSGIAWLGKNTNVISPEYGSWIFLGELLTSLDLKPDEPLETLCAGCRKCIDACPTGALDTPFVLDATRCISYVTIERRGEHVSAEANSIGVDVYGCDTCQSVCPFNRVASESVHFRASDRSGLLDMTLDELMSITDDEFDKKTRGSAARRVRAEGIRRNAAAVKANVAAGRISRWGEKRKK